MSSEKVDAYIARTQPFAQPILRHIRQLVHQTLPDAEEAIKWGVPHFVVDGKNAVGMASFKAHASLMLCSDDNAGEGMGNFGKITSLADLPDDAELARRFRESAEAAQNRTANSPKPKPVIPMQDDLAAALAATPGAPAIWDGFTDAQRRDYLDWITSAKRAPTRAKRVAQAAEWIGEGKRRNWKYENC